MLQKNIREALRHNRLNSRNLSCFAIDVEAYLTQTDLFSKIRMKKTGAPTCALVVRCTLVDPATSPATIVAGLERVWIEAPLGYGDGCDAYEFETQADSVHMHFLTVASYGMVVTGRIEVTGFNK